MNNEIKEILDKLKNDDWYDELDLTGDKWIELKQTETKQLLDYITNLQQELEEEKRIEEADLKTIQRLEEENERLNEILVWKQEHEKELHTRIEKASEYLDNRMKEFKNAGSSRKNIKAYHYYLLLSNLLDIVSGDDNVSDRN